MKIVKYVIMLTIFLFSNVLNGAELSINLPEVVEEPYQISRIETPINIQIQITNEQRPFSYIIKPDINDGNSITGIFDNTEATLQIPKTYYNKPGIYIARIIIQDNAGNIGEKEVIINYCEDGDGRPESQFWQG